MVRWIAFSVCALPIVAWAATAMRAEENIVRCFYQCSMTNLSLRCGQRQMAVGARWRTLQAPDRQGDRPARFALAAGAAEKEARRWQAINSDPNSSSLTPILPSFLLSRSKEVS